MARRFRFRLDTVLRVRALREREARRKFGVKLAEIAAVERLNAETSAEIAARQARLLSSQRRTIVDPRELAAGRAWVGYLRRQLAERQAVKAALRNELNALREELRQARAQSRMLEKLRERKHAEWKRDADRQEQTDSDELARQLPGFAASAAAQE
jgi:flagellar FliJ protein